jgi:hypothetical protein
VERPGRRPVGEVNDGGECGIQAFLVRLGIERGGAGCRRGRGGGIVASCIHSAGEEPVAQWARDQEADGGGAVKLLEEGDNERTLGRDRPGGLGV